MTLHLPVLVLLALVAGPAAAIVNGTPPSEARYREAFGWVVALEHEGSDGVCTGELIAPSWVLTAAHCTSSKVRVRAGAVDRRLAQSVNAAEVFVHPEFDAVTGENDVGLIRLAQPLALSPVRLINAAQASVLIREGAHAVIAGWGRRSSHQGHSYELIVSDVELRGLQRESGRFAYYDPVSGPCGGDSGGPLLLARADGRWVLAGVASRVGGDVCAQGGGVGIYVEVSAVRRFIEAHVKELR